jgi:predicted nucleic acid-binding protein
MGIVLDSDLIIRSERGQFALDDWLVGQPQEEFYVAAITVAELWHGVARAEGIIRSRRQRFLEGAISAVEILPYTEVTAHIHAKVWAKLQKAGTMIGQYDLIIAATAIEHGLQLATFNVRHFRLIAELPLVEIGH